MKRNFQTLVVFHQVLIFSSAVVQSVTDSWLTPVMRAFLGVETSLLDDEQGVASSGQTLYILRWAVTLIGLFASAGVPWFRAWGRTLFVFVSFVSLLVIPFSEFYVDAGWTVLVGAAAGIIEGMLIALMYFSPLRRVFRGGDRSFDYSVRGRVV